MFKLLETDGHARAGLLETKHGSIKTPMFMPVGTKGSVKGLTQEHLHDLGAEIILGNTYHLFLRPGHKEIESLGGLHKFISWNKPILTDSGGFQLFSLESLRQKITEEGVAFSSHIDGRRFFLSPELSMEIQKSLGSDIVMCFDYFPKLPATDAEIHKSIHLSYRWAKRCKDFPLAPHQILFGILQGGTNIEKRLESLQLMEELDFPGLAIGGLAVGEPNEEMYRICHEFVPKLPKDKPRYLMGVGKPLDILEAISSGVDLFDCVLPTRNARNGQVFTKFGPINLKNERFKLDANPIEKDCLCLACKSYSRSYIRHLIFMKEPLGITLATYHNLYFYFALVRNARKAILEKTFKIFYKDFKQNYLEGNII
jgi:queuine tRNA-ribosyltransferase